MTSSPNEDRRALPGTTSKLPRIAVCSSGGGIRSASYNLGAMQRLAEDGKRVLRVDAVSAVSGGSYMAAARSLVGETKGFAHAFSPGSDEEQRLRRNTHYLLPNAQQWLRGLLSLVFGAVVNMALVLSPIYVAMHVWGLVLRRTNVIDVTPRSGGTIVSTARVLSWPAWLAIGLAALTVALVLADRFKRATQVERWDGTVFLRPAVWSLIAAVVVALFGIAAPALLHAITASPDHPVSQSAGNTSTGSGTLSFAAFAGGLAVFARLAIGSISPMWTRLEKDTKNGLSKITKRAGRFIVPWLGSAGLLLGIGLFATLWIAGGASSGFSWWRVGLVGAIFVALQWGLDINRTSLHDFYRDRMEAAYSDASSPLRPLLSELQTAPELTICASANIDAVGDLPPGRGAASFTFSPEWTELRFASDECGREQDLWRAKTVAYEKLLGRNRLSLFDIVAISGAAISPIMGRMTCKAQRLLLAMANVRLGVWLPHPILVAAAYQEVLSHANPSDNDVDSQRPGSTAHRRGRGRLRRLRWLSFILDQRAKREANSAPDGMGTPHNGPPARPVQEDLTWVFQAIQLTKEFRQRSGLRKLPVVWRALKHWRKRSAGTRDERVFAKDLTWLQQAFEFRAQIDGRPGTPTAGWGTRLRAALHWRAHQSSLFLLWAEAVGHNRRGQRWLYVTDGGHYDNLGLVSALRPNPEKPGQTPGEIFVIDASGDQPHKHTTLGEAVALARTELGVEIDIDPTAMELPDVDTKPTPWVNQAYVSGTFRYCRGRELSDPRPLHVIKLGVWQQSDLSWDVRAYASGHVTFPRDSTVQQLYDDQEFEAYRSLGYASMNALLKSLDPPATGRHEMAGTARPPAPTPRSDSKPNKRLAAAASSPDGASARHTNSG